MERKISASRSRRPAPQEQDADPYLVRAVSRACDILEAFRFPRETLRLREICSRTGMSPGTAFRITHTLVARGLLERAGERRYRSTVQPLRPHRFRIGYAAQSAEFAFTREVTGSIERAAAGHDVDLIVLNNRYSPRAALRNADAFIREKADLVIEFQSHTEIASTLSSRFLNAKIPVIAVEIPHPGAVFFGADNYRAGRIGGRALGRWARAHWQGQVDEVLLLELPMAGPLPESRLTGFLGGLQETLPGAGRRPVVHLNGNGQFSQSLTAVRRYLQQAPPRRTLVGAVNDPSALGAVRAFEEAGRAELCAVVGQNASAEARAELRRPGTRLIGSVGYFPEKYGDAILRLALDILNKKPAPAAKFTQHRLITAENVDRFYPNDPVLERPEWEAMLFHTA